MILKDAETIKEKLLQELTAAKKKYNTASFFETDKIRARRRHVAFIDALNAVEIVPEEKAIPAKWLKAAAEDTTYQHAVNRLIDLYEKTQEKKSSRSEAEEEETRAAFWKIPEGSSFRSYGWECSKCGGIATQVPRGSRNRPTVCSYNYCPACGCKMTGSETKQTL